MKSSKWLPLIFVATLGLSACAATPTAESTGQYVDNSAVTAKVKTALLNAPGLESTDISVESYKGTVQLSGFVNSAAQSQQAQATAAAVPGVQGVTNSLVIK